MTSFLKRTISGALFITLIIGAILLGQYTFSLVFFVLMELTMLEFYKLSFKARVKPQHYFGMTLGAVVFAINYFFAIGTIGNYIFLGIIPLVLSIFLIEIYRNHQKPMHNIAYTLLGIIYVAFPFSLLNYFVLSHSSYSIGFEYHILLGYFIMLWANDTGAYVVGLSIGRNKLFPRISPKKSWEGLVGGLFFSVLAAWILSMFYYDISLSHWIAIGLITAISGVFGDLVESMFKRSVGVKDSGKIMPGHGGLLDRFDCVLISAPIVFVYLKIMMII